MPEPMQVRVHWPVLPSSRQTKPAAQSASAAQLLPRVPAPMPLVSPPPVVVVWQLPETQLWPLAHWSELVQLVQLSRGSRVPAGIVRSVRGSRSWPAGSHRSEVHPPADDLVQPRDDLGRQPRLAAEHGEAADLGAGRPMPAVTVSLLLVLAGVTDSHGRSEPNRTRIARSGQAAAVLGTPLRRRDLGRPVPPPWARSTPTPASCLACSRFA
jgi:hypothetical protein